MCLEDAFLREAARSVEVDPEGMEILPILGSRDPRIEQIGLLLKEEIEAEGASRRQALRRITNDRPGNLSNQRSLLAGKEGR